jgi:hypothetical protein
MVLDAPDAIAAHYPGEMKALLVISSQEDFIFDNERDIYTCPAGKILTTTPTSATKSALLRHHGVIRPCPLL